MRVPVDGISDEALVDEGTDARSILSDLGGNNPDFDGDGVVFELNELTMSNESTTVDGVVEIWDANEGASPGAANQKLTIVIPANTTVERKWDPGYGPTFRTGIVASLDGGNGTVNAGGVHAAGALLM